MRLCIAAIFGLHYAIQCNINDTVGYTLFKNCIINSQRIIDKIDNQKFIENIYSLQPKVSHQFKLAMSP